MSPLEILERRFLPFDFGARRTRLSGVYLLVDGDEIVYVGASVDVHRRLRDHRAYDPDDLVNFKKFDRALVMRTRPSSLEFVEAALIRALKPKRNLKCDTFSHRDNAVLARLGLPKHRDASENDWQFHQLLSKRRAERRSLIPGFYQKSRWHSAPNSPCHPVRQVPI